MIVELLSGKNVLERSNIKSDIISKLDVLGLHSEKTLGIDIEVLDIKKSGCGIEILARAFKGGLPVGFGNDGTVEIERFRIFNPPVMVPNGTKKEIRYPFRHDVFLVDNFKEDPKSAILTCVADIVRSIGKDGNKIVKGKIGHTTSTFYPDAGKPGTNSCDGDIDYRSAADYETAHDAATGTHVDFNGTSILYAYNTKSAGLYYVTRALINFYTADIPDSDIISSAVLSLYFTAAWTSDSMSIVGNTGASANDYSTADFDQFGTTKFAADKPVLEISTGQYTDFTLNASGLAAISKTGVSKFGMRSAEDVANTTPTVDHGAGASSADVAGTTQDPKLVVVHSAPAVGRSFGLII